jgi:L-ascorbate metabolism protein UlaG (beta-lactamase superfamily)
MLHSIRAIAATRYDVRMRIVRLFWAGVQIESEGATLVIDLLEHTVPIRSFMGNPRLPIVFGPKVLDLALVTHLHPDHYDPDALRRKLRPDAKVFCDPVNAPKISRDGFAVMGATLYEPISVGPFTVTALPAVDGLGDPQVSFLVEAEDIKLMHFGDTLWHGHWWKIRARCGPPDVAFLPINGAITQFPNMKPSGIPADLMPDQAASAAAILETRVACPIHYGAFHNPPVYVELPDVERMFLEAADRLGVVSQIIDPGNEIAISGGSP